MNLITDTDKQVALFLSRAKHESWLEEDANHFLFVPVFMHLTSKLAHHTLHDIKHHFLAWLVKFLGK